VIGKPPILGKLHSRSSVCDAAPWCMYGRGRLFGSQCVPRGFGGSCQEKSTSGSHDSLGVHFGGGSISCGGQGRLQSAAACGDQVGTHKPAVGSIRTRHTSGGTAPYQRAGFGWRAVEL